MPRISPISDFFGAVALRGLALLGVSDSANPLTAEEIVELCLRLLSSRGDASGLALSYRILTSYDLLDEHQKCAFFEQVAIKFAVNLDEAAATAESFLQVRNPEQLEAMKAAASPRYSDLINRLNQVPSATMQIVSMRADLLKYLPEFPDLRPLDRAFTQVFSSWFNRGFLGLRNIDWSTGAAILENIIKYEAVHGIAGWADLARRIKPDDRLIYGFFHRNLEIEPLIFIEVALTNNIPAAIDEILSDDRTQLDPNQATTAVFYSISNCQDGLRGVPLGNFLIKQVVEDLKSRFPHLKDFVTLSPIVKFADWLRASDFDVTGLPTELNDVRKSLTKISRKSDKAREPEKSLLKAAAHFLTVEKAGDGKPIDPVCRFHIGNGARLERLNWASHLTDGGFENAYTIMANYRYIIEDIEMNHEAFVNEGIVTTSVGLKKLLAPARIRKQNEPI